MKTTYTIGEVAKMLNLGIDALRFYEKKGLVHPQINKSNQYREYTMKNILEILDIIYYRHLEMSVKDIQVIVTSGSKESMKALLQSKRKETEKRIRYEQQLLKKIQYMESIYDEIDKREGVCTLRKLPASYILSRFDDACFVDEVVKLSQDEYVLSSFYSTYSLSKQTYQDTYLSIEEYILKDLQLPYPKEQYPYVQEQNCIYMITPLKQMTIQQKGCEALLAYAKQHNYITSDTLYIKEIPLTSYQDEDNYYAELYLPIV